MRFAYTNKSDFSDLIKFIKFQIAYENTYKMEPPEKFRPDKVRPIIQKVLSTNLEGNVVLLNLAKSYHTYHSMCMPVTVNIF